jgi:nitrite reductase/ring-hydroxylating ferredoxin subunit
MDESSRLKAIKFVCERASLVDAGQAARFEIRRGDRELPAFAVAFDGEVHAWVNVCPHRGTSLDWQPGEVFDDSGIYLICSTHGALFEPDTGVCIDGPCRGAMLSAVPVTVQEGEVRLTQDNRVLGQDS